MALINCSECGKDVSDKAFSCPNCGNPINQGKQSENQYLCCPNCQSRDLHAEKKGFGGAKAVTGALLTGGIGILAGTMGSKDVYLTCLRCGERFDAGKAKVGGIETEKINQELRDIIKAKGLLMAVSHYNKLTNAGMVKSKLYVDELIKREGIELQKGKGCASVILAMLFLITLFFILY